MTRDEQRQILRGLTKDQISAMSPEEISQFSAEEWDRYAGFDEWLQSSGRYIENPTGLSGLTANTPIGIGFHSKDVGIPGIENTGNFTEWNKMVQNFGSGGPFSQGVFGDILPDAVQDFGNDTMQSGVNNAEDIIHAAMIAAGGNAMLGAGGATSGTGAVATPLVDTGIAAGSGVPLVEGTTVAGTAAAGTTLPVSMPAGNSLASGATNAAASGATNAMNWLDPALIAGGSLVSGYLGSETAKDNAAINQANYEQTRTDFAPWLESGTQGLADYNSMIRGEQPENYNAFAGGDRFEFDLESDPGYRFARDEAVNAVNRNSARGGQTNSGRRMAEIGDRVTGLASTYANDAYNRQLGASNTNYGRNVGEYGLDVNRNQDIYNRFQDSMNRFQGLSNQGQTATGTISNAGQSATANAMNANTMGNQSINNAIQGGLNNYLTYDYMKNNPYNFNPYSR